jgi:hypothetical protein
LQGGAQEADLNLLKVSKEFLDYRILMGYHITQAL